MNLQGAQGGLGPVSAPLPAVDGNSAGQASMGGAVGGFHQAPEFVFLLLALGLLMYFGFVKVKVKGR